MTLADFAQKVRLANPMFGRKATTFTVITPRGQFKVNDVVRQGDNVFGRTPNGHEKLLGHVSDKAEIV